MRMVEEFAQGGFSGFEETEEFVVDFFLFFVSVVCVVFVSVLGIWWCMLCYFCRWIRKYNFVYSRVYMLSDVFCVLVNVFNIINVGLKGVVLIKFLVDRVSECFPKFTITR